MCLQHGRLVCPVPSFHGVNRRIRHSAGRRPPPFHSGSGSDSRCRSRLAPRTPYTHCPSGHAASLTDPGGRPAHARRSPASTAAANLAAVPPRVPFQTQGLLHARLGKLLVRQRPDRQNAGLDWPQALPIRPDRAALIMQSISGKWEEIHAAWQRGLLLPASSTGRWRDFDGLPRKRRNRRWTAWPGVGHICCK